MEKFAAYIQARSMCEDILRGKTSTPFAVKMQQRVDKVWAKNQEVIQSGLGVMVHYYPFVDLLSKIYKGTWDTDENEIVFIFTLCYCVSQTLEKGPFIDNDISEISYAVATTVYPSIHNLGGWKNLFERMEHHDKEVLLAKKARRLRVAVYNGSSSDDDDDEDNA